VKRVLLDISEFNALSNYLFNTRCRIKKNVKSSQVSDNCLLEEK